MNTTKTYKKYPKMSTNLLPAYELKSCQQFPGVFVSEADGKPGQAGRAAQRGRADAATHELVRSLWRVVEHAIFFSIEYMPLVNSTVQTVSQLT